jgi:D-aspartate ligase
MPLPRAILLAPVDGGMALTRSLAERGVEVHMLVEDRASWAGGSRWATKHVVGPLPEHADGWVAELQELAGSGDGVIISSTDRATEMLVWRRDEVPPSLRSFESRSSAHLSLMDKASLYEIAERAGVRYPRTMILSDRRQIERIGSEATFPCLVKPVHSHRWDFDLGRKAVVVEDPEELRRHVRPALEAGLELLISEHIPGPDGHLEGAYTVRRADGCYPMVLGRRKVRMHPPGYGAASIMESAQVPETIAASRKLLDAADFVGLSSAEFKLHAKTGERYLIEVNVRLPQAWGIVDVAGVEGSWRLYASLAGLPLEPQPAQRAGVRNVIPSLEIRAVPTHLAERELSIREVAAGYRGVRGISGLSLSDPRPIALLASEYLRWISGRLRGRDTSAQRHGRPGLTQPAQAGSARARTADRRYLFPVPSQAGSHPAPAIVLGGVGAALSITRSLGRAGIPVYVLGDARYSLAGKSRFCREFVDLGCREGMIERWLEWLREAPPGSVVLPCGDHGLELIAAHGDELRELGLRPLETAGDASLAMLDKERTYEIAREAGVPTPSIWRARDLEELEGIAEEVEYPCALKPLHSHLFSRHFGDRKVFVAESHEDLRDAMRKTSRHDLEMLVSEIIPAADDQVWSLHTFIDETGEPLFEATKQKLRCYPIHFGVGTYHVIRWDPEVVEMGRRFLRAAGIRGLASVEFKRDERDGGLRLIECNHRFSAVNEVFCRAGVPVPLVAYRRALGQTMTTTRPRSGVRMWIPALDARAASEMRREGSLTWPRWALSLIRPRMHMHVLSLDDLAPSFHNTARKLRNRSTRLLRGRRSRSVRTAVGYVPVASEAAAFAPLA